MAMIFRYPVYSVTYHHARLDSRIGSPLLGSIVELLRVELFLPQSWVAQGQEVDRFSQCQWIQTSFEIWLQFNVFCISLVICKVV